MNSIRTVARLGLVHHMLYGRTLADPVQHDATLRAVASRKDIETLDCCLPDAPDIARALSEFIRTSGKTHVTFAIHRFPFARLSLTATTRHERAEVRAILATMVRQAAEMGATGFIFASGGPPFAAGTQAHHAAFCDLCRWLCDLLAPHGIDALLEPFDFDCDKRFLYGPLDRNVELVATLAASHPNVGIELDMAHLPLMHEEFERAIRLAAPVLRRVHLGNCVLRDAGDPFHGDRHPPIGYPGGEIDVPELVRILRTLREVGYLQPTRRGNLILEINAFPGWSDEQSVQDNFRRIETAWSEVTDPCAPPQRTTATR